MKRRSENDRPSEPLAGQPPAGRPGLPLAPLAEDVRVDIARELSALASSLQADSASDRPESRGMHRGYVAPRLESGRASFRSFARPYYHAVVVAAPPRATRSA
jgi:hypothetical protein